MAPLSVGVRSSSHLALSRHALLHLASTIFAKYLYGVCVPLLLPVL